DVERDPENHVSSAKHRWRSRSYGRKSKRDNYHMYGSGSERVVRLLQNKPALHPDPYHAPGEQRAAEDQLAMVARRRLVIQSRRGSLGSPCSRRLCGTDHMAEIHHLQPGSEYFRCRAI